ncbi:hypothetical protein FACS189418_4350 [Clostridia bacterium]|nr:hypothetical protein FACS189418_4350 [Clostridia bacterium]
MKNGKIILRRLAIACLGIPVLFIATKTFALSDVESPLAGAAMALSHYYNSGEDGLEIPLVKASRYDNVAITNVSHYVNIRTVPATSGEVVGKIYNESVGTIIETVEGEDGQWYQVQSGTVNGYIKAEYFLTGDEAAAVAKKVGTVLARIINASTVRLRVEADMDSDTLSLLSEDSEYIVLEETDEFVKLQVDADLIGYVPIDYVDIRIEFKQAISIEEEQAQKEEQERVRKEAEAAKREEDIRKEAERALAKKNIQEPNAEYVPDSADETTTRNAIIAYAKQFLGNPYVWGGTSLTKGADCSGFTMSIYREFGISTGRTSRDQAAKGKKISITEVRPGDLIFYDNGKGTINHVAMYIGDLKVIHASNSRTGIIISNMYYRTPCKAATFLK